jgi:long-chain fatty acid transport protein
MKKILGLIVCLVAFTQASMIGLDALGEEHVVGGSAAAAGRGYAGGAKTGEAEGLSVTNPARMAFDTKVVFNLNFLLEFYTAERHGDSYFTKNLAMPSFNLSFPMGDFGAFGVSLWQHYSSVIREEISDSASSAEAKIEYNGSVYEIVPTYAVRLPYLRNISLGAAMHVVMGSMKRSLTLGPNKDAVAEEDVWATNNKDITDYVDGSWEIEHHPGYYTGSIQYRGRQSSFYFSYTTGYTLLNELEYNFRFSELDTLVPSKIARRIEVPAMFATGVNYRLAKRHNVMMDLQWRVWDEDVENVGHSYDMRSVTKTQDDFVASIGYQRDGSGLYYDPFWDRITYRAGAWYKNWYIKDVYEIGGSVGANFPLGRKGIAVDLALQGGKRISESRDNWEEVFLGMRLGLMGIGSWGQSRR